MNTDNVPSPAIERLALGPLKEALSGVDAYLVGGAARAIAGGLAPGGDIDIAVDGELDPILERLEGTPRRHDRFATARIPLDDGRHVDIARTRTEAYPTPGALPVVSPAPIEDDLGRRDFTVNAIAISLAPPHRIVDPFDGRGDVASGVLRALHPESFADDPTRVVRGARYCARLGLDPEPATAEMLAAADLDLVSADRRISELRRLADEEVAPAAFELLSRWGVLKLPESALALMQSVDETASDATWGELKGARSDALLLVANGGSPLEDALRLAAEHPSRPSEAVALARALDDPVLLVAAAAGAAWISSYLHEWRHVGLEIGGEDLIAAGIRPGPPVGAGLREALRMKLDGELEPGRQSELDAAVRIARGTA